jgi:hypothetical protein
MKTCSKCKLHLPLTDFGKKNNGHQTYCLPCNRAHSREYYAANKESQKSKILERNRRYRKELREFIKQIKEDAPCLDCGVRYPWYVMDFDHVLGDKYMEVSAMVANLYSKEKILKEIAKCELICSNCHRIRTFAEKPIEAEELLL